MRVAVQWRTTPGRAARALVGAVLVAAGVTAAPFLAFVGPFGILAFVVAAPIWSVGMILLGVPAWLIMHSNGWRSPGAFVGVGLGLTFLGSLALAKAIGVAGAPLVLPILLAVVGGFSGWVLHRWAYGKAPTADYTCFSDDEPVA